jgi:5'(3')-deoxyribonucleotidase
MRIFIDIDNTMSNLIGHYITWYNNLFIYTTEKEKPLDNDILHIIDNWDFPSYLNKNKNSASLEIEKSRLVKIFNSQGFWSTLPLFPNVEEIINELILRKYEIYFLTAPSFNSQYFFNERISWVKRNFPQFNYEKLIFCKPKHLLYNEFNRSVLIEDFPENLLNWGGKTIKVNYSYNENIKSTKSFDPKNWKIVPQLLEELE